MRVCMRDEKITSDHAWRVAAPMAVPAPFVHSKKAGHETEDPRGKGAQ